MSDGELVRQTLAGRTAAYDDLVRRWAARVTAVCHARVGRADVAEELAQETLFRGFRSLASLSDVERFGSWLCGIATRVCLDWLKDKDRSIVTFNALGEDARAEDMPDGHVGNDPETADELTRLMHEVERLPLKHREVLMLYYYEDRTYQELADSLGVSAATINARLTQARQMLREKLTARQSPVE